MLSVVCLGVPSNLVCDAQPLAARLQDVTDRGLADVQVMFGSNALTNVLDCAAWIVVLYLTDLLLHAARDFYTASLLVGVAILWQYAFRFQVTRQQ